MEKLYATSADTNTQLNTSYQRSHYLHLRYTALIGRKELPTFKARYQFLCRYSPRLKAMPTVSSAENLDQG